MPDQKGTFLSAAGLNRPAIEETRMQMLHKFLSPTTTAVTLDSFGDNLPFELGPWKSLGVAVLIGGRDAAIVEDVLANGYHLSARAEPERTHF
ncbi:MAG: hypothetical protein ACJ8IR_10740 [Alphaproteobacteria bacterium]